MRARFAREGHDTVLGYHYDVGALQFGENTTYRIFWGNDFRAENWIGNASELKREEDGWITAEVEWTNERGEEASEMLGRDCVLTIYGRHVVYGPEVNHQKQVKSIELMALFVSIMIDGDNPWDLPWEQRTDEDE